MTSIYDPEKDSLRCACRDYAAWLAKEEKLSIGEKSAPVRITLRSEKPLGTQDGVPFFGEAVFVAAFEHAPWGYRAASSNTLRRSEGAQDLLTFEFTFTHEEIDLIRARVTTPVDNADGKD